MKRRALVRHLEQNSCRLLREGANHSIFVSPTGRTSTVPRHTEINEDLGKKILDDSGLPIITANNMAEAGEKVVAATKSA